MARAVLIGHSQTKYLSKYLEQCDVISYSGYKVEDFLCKTEVVQAVQQAQVVFIHAGINNIPRDTPSTVLSKFRKLYSYIRACNPGSLVLFSSILPRGQNNFPDGKKMTHKELVMINQSIDTVNKGLKKAALGTKGLSFLDNHQFKEGIKIRRALLSRDGLHLSYLGTAILARNLQAFLNRADVVLQNRTCVQPLRNPEPIIPEPVSEPFIPEPVIAEPVIAEPVIAEPVIPEPVSEPFIPEPASEPIIPEPVSEPVIPEPVSEPVIPEPVSEPVIPEPVSEPVIPEPVSEPIIPEPVSEPVNQVQSKNLSRRQRKNFRNRVRQDKKIKAKDHVNPEPLKPEPVKPEPVKSKPVKPEPVNQVQSKKLSRRQRKNIRNVDRQAQKTKPKLKKNSNKCSTSVFLSNVYCQYDVYSVVKWIEDSNQKPKIPKPNKRSNQELKNSIRKPNILTGGGDSCPVYDESVNRELGFLEAVNIFANINHEKVTNNMPFNPQPCGGHLYMYSSGLDNTKRDDWKCDGYRWYQSGIPKKLN